MSQLCKRQLRATLRARRRSLPHEAQVSAMTAVSRLARSLPEWPDAHHIAVYHATDGEIGTESLTKLCRAQKKHVYLPRTGANGSMVFTQWREGDNLMRNRVGICEPQADAKQYPVTELDIVFLPLVGWDQWGGRLGMGAGYYDKALANAAGPLLVGLAHQLQQVEQIPTDPWDIPLDLIITEKAIHSCKAQKQGIHCRPRQSPLIAD